MCACGSSRITLTPSPGVTQDQPLLHPLSSHSFLFPPSFPDLFLRASLTLSFASVAASDSQTEREREGEGTGLTHPPSATLDAVCLSVCVCIADQKSISNPLSEYEWIFIPSTDPRCVHPLSQRFFHRRSSRATHAHTQVSSFSSSSSSDDLNLPTAAASVLSGACLRSFFFCFFFVFFHVPLLPTPQTPLRPIVPSRLLPPPQLPLQPLSFLSAFRMLLLLITDQCRRKCDLR